MAAWITNCMIAFLIATNSAISVCILYDMLPILALFLSAYLRILLLTQNNGIVLRCSNTYLTEYDNLLCF